MFWNEGINPNYSQLMPNISKDIVRYRIFPQLSVKKLTKHEPENYAATMASVFDHPMGWEWG